MNSETKLSHRERAKALVSQMTLAEKCAQMKYDAPAIPRLNVPEYNWWNEALHGVARSGAATVFPQAIGMAASFDTELMHSVATAISDEMRAKYNEYRKFGGTRIYQGLTAWSPNINIFRDPRWGRGHETYGEDPYLTGTMGTAFITGMQGDDPDYYKTDATLKHYAVHSGPEDLRHGFDAEADDTDLYETYLWAFRYCIDHAHPAAVMGAYNRVNGEPSCASPRLLQEILYREFKFDGYVLSDCGAICDINRSHHVTANEAESAALAVNNGCILNCGDAYKWLITAVTAGMISEETITAAVEKLFETRFRLGMFDEDCPYNAIDDQVVECREHLALSRKMAQEGIVLLKNDGILPLQPDMNIAVIGPNADDLSVLLGNYNGTPTKHTTILEGILHAATGKVRYSVGCDILNANPGRWDEHPLREAVIAAQKSDVILLCMGLNPHLEGEQADDFNGALSGDKSTLDLPASQLILINEILQLGKPVVFLNISGSCINLSRVHQECNAVLQVFYPGAEGGDAVADILFGKVSPSGRLPVTFYASDGDLPAFTDYAMKDRTYKYFRKEPLYPFAHGLSYTTFSYENLCFDGESVSGLLKNTGSMDSGHVIPIFLKDPEDNTVNCRLAGYARLELKAGESARFHIPLCPEIVRRFSCPERLTALAGGVNGIPVALSTRLPDAGTE